MSEADITVEVPMDGEGVVYIFRGPASSVDERVDLWLSMEEPTWDETRPMTATDWEEVESYVMPDSQPDPRDSEAYQRALLAQLDYDSTRTGMNGLKAQIQAAQSPQDAKALHARLIAGEAAHELREHMLAVMPPMPQRGTETYTDWHRPLARLREEIAQHLALATAETRAFSRPSPQTVDRIVALTGEADHYAGHFDQRWWGPADGRGAAPWIAEETRQVQARDVPMLWALGVAAQWDGQKITAGGDLSAAWAFGYRTTRPSETGEVVVVSVSDAVKWCRENA